MGAVGRNAVAGEDLLAAAVHVLVPQDDLALAVLEQDAMGLTIAARGRLDEVDEARNRVLVDRVHDRILERTDR